MLHDADGIAKGLVGLRTKWQAPGASEGTTALVDGISPDRSAILLRMRSRGPSTQMPPLSTVLRDRLAIETLSQWIRQDVLAGPDVITATPLQASHVR